MAEITNRTGLVLTLPFAICEINLLQQICVQYIHGLCVLVKHYCCIIVPCGLLLTVG